MSWASRRRLLIFIILGAIAVAFAIIVFFTAFYQAPSCHDGVQNEGEQGIDCGGPCPYLCTELEQAPTVLFTQVLPGVPGTTDVIASLENRNATAAAKDVPYTITLYGTGQALVQTISGTVDLPPGATVPIYVPHAATGSQLATQAFLSINASAIQWYSLAHDPRLLPQVSNITLGGTADAPRIFATLSDPNVAPLTNVEAVVIVRDAADNVIGASQTIVPEIAGQGQAIATFTWNTPFPRVPVAIEVDPIAPLP